MPHQAELFPGTWPMFHAEVRFARQAETPRAGRHRAEPVIAPDTRARLKETAFRLLFAVACLLAGLIIVLAFLGRFACGGA